VRGAAQVVQTALRHGDRAGIVALGGNRPKGSAQQLRGVAGQFKQRLREDPQTHCD
jgi:uncharacterized protein (DUF58 family)